MQGGAKTTGLELRKTGDKALDHKAEALLTPFARELLVVLHRSQQEKRLELLLQRRVCQMQVNRGSLPTWVENHPCQRENWQVAPIPADLVDRRVEITGPVNSAKMVIQMLSKNEQGARADTAMLDFEDSMKPTWENVIDGVANVKAVALGELSYEKLGPGGSIEKVYSLDPSSMAKMMVRVRGLHLDEPHVSVDGVPVPAALFDLALCAVHSAREQLNKRQTPKFYVPKCEHFLEARWWNEAFRTVERFLGLPLGSLRATFLIETLPAAFQMEEILYEVRERACGLNVGRWDKIFSDIKLLREHREFIFTDRALIGMQSPWMDNYAKLLIKTCHKHGAFAIGGMSAFTPGKEEATRRAQIEKVVADKAREAAIGHDGCWVSHPYFIGVAREQFRQKNQLSASLADFPSRPNLLPEKMPPPSMAGLRTNARAAIAYQKGWNEGFGTVAFDNLMEDLATLEISRAQVWQWLHHSVALESGEVVTPGLVSKVFEEEYRDIAAVSSDLPALTAAKDQAKDLFLERELREFFRTSV